MPKKNKILLLGLILIFIITSGLGCKFQSKKLKEALQPVTLTYWRVWDDSSSFDGLISAYHALHPNITIQYKKLRYEEYENKLLNALAEDRGPDIFSVHNTWLGKYQNKLLPLPATITIPYQYQKGSIKKETVVELKTTKSLSLLNLKNKYIDAVYSDVVRKDSQGKEQIYALPLSVDTLALFYNRELFNAAGIAQPPQTWDEFQEDVKKITKIDEQDNILQSAVGMGTSSNVARSSDILSILMMQNGTKMESNGRATFHKVPSGQKERFYPGEDALIFYTDFANPSKLVYTWNKDMPNSLDAFVQGRTAMFFGYAYNIPDIKAFAPKLDLGIAKLPQIEGNPEINFANYWVEGVSKKTKHPNEAWDFIQFITNEKNVVKYLDKANKPTALRSLIGSQKENPELNVFANQLLTAKSWYHGKDANAVELVFKDLIDTINKGELEPRKALNLAAQRVDQTYR